MAKMDPSKNWMNPVVIYYKSLIVLLIVKSDKRFVGDEERKIYAKGKTAIAIWEIDIT